jgi:two-component system cell cycle sensor histidine kinase/response regulator CckA
LILLDRGGLIRYINYTVPDLAIADVLGTSVYQYVPEEYREVMRRCHDRVLGSGQPDRYETAYVAENGETSWWESRVSPVVREGEIVGLVQIASNVTERRQAAADRDRLFNLSVDMLCIASTDGYFKRLNPAFEHTLGYRVEELLAAPFRDFVHEDDRVSTEAAVARMAQGEQLIDFENRYRCRDGTYRRISWRASSDTTGRLIYAIGRDVTDTRNLERQLHESQKLDAVGQLAGGIAHDFNNLLTAIELNTQVALRDKDDAVRAEHLQEVRRAAQRAADLTRQLLAFARRRPPALALVSVNEVADGMLSLLRRLIPADIEIAFEPAAELGPIMGDAAQLEQVVLNLCVNARDAMPGGGRLTIETRTDGAAVQLVVRDTGVGMAPEVRERIFEPFFTTKPLGRGTGLGLATVYAIVQQHKGRIRVDSELDRGSSFQLDFPAGEGVVQTSKPPPMSVARGGSETILVAEDEPGVRSAVVALLENAGYRVLVAHDGQEAVQLFEQHAGQVSAVLLDMVMPKLGGPLAARQMRKARPQIPVVFMSGYSSAAELGVSSLPRVSRLDKPFEPDALLRKIREALDGV